MHKHQLTDTGHPLIVVRWGLQRINSCTDLPNHYTAQAGKNLINKIGLSKTRRKRVQTKELETELAQDRNKHGPVRHVLAI